MLAVVLGCSDSYVDPVPLQLSAPPQIRLREGESTTLVVVASRGAKVRVVAPQGLHAEVAAQHDEDISIIVTGSSPLDAHDKVDVIAEKNGATVRTSIAVEWDRMHWDPTWQLPEALEPREHPAVIVDAARGRMLVLGGGGYRTNKPLADAWQVSLDTGESKPVVLDGDPFPAASAIQVAIEPGASMAYLFGGMGIRGDGSPQLLNDLYALDLAPERPVVRKVQQPRGAPPARTLHGFSIDAGRLFVFGGLADVPRNDLWVGTLESGAATWQEVEGRERPSKRYSFAYGQLPGKLLIYSGAQDVEANQPAADLWALDTRRETPAFTHLLGGESVPVARKNSTFAVDSVRQRLYVFGGESDLRTVPPGLWMYDARESFGRFVLVAREGEPALRGSGAGVVNSKSGAFYLGLGSSRRTVYSDLTRLTF